MGFNSSFSGHGAGLERETLVHLENHEELAIALSGLILELKRDQKNVGIKVQIEGLHGEVLLMNVIGVNSTSLVSSEMEGHISFTFIKNVKGLRIVSLAKETSHSPKLTLIK